VLARAEAQVPERERALDALLHEVERRDQGVRAREAEVAARDDEATGRIANLEAREQLAAEREKELRRTEKDADQRARRQARDYLLEARNRVEAALAAASNARTEEEAKDARRVVEESISARDEGGKRRADRRRADGRRAEGGQHVRVESDQSADAGVAPAERVAGNVRCRTTEMPKCCPSPVCRQPVPGRSEDAEFEIDLRGLRVDGRDGGASALGAAVTADNPSSIIRQGTDAVQTGARPCQGDRRITAGLAPASQGGSGATIGSARERSDDHRKVRDARTGGSSASRHLGAPAPTIGAYRSTAGRDATFGDPKKALLPSCAMGRRRSPGT
jgi:hypothetical protein